jgi:hypothetical protein
MGRRIPHRLGSRAIARQQVPKNKRRCPFLGYRAKILRNFIFPDLRFSCQREHKTFIFNRGAIIFLRGRDWHPSCTNHSGKPSLAFPGTAFSFNAFHRDEAYLISSLLRFQSFCIFFQIGPRPRRRSIIQRAASLSPKAFRSSPMFCRSSMRLFLLHDVALISHGPPHVSCNLSIHVRGLKQ